MKSGLNILGMGYAYPENRIDNLFLENLETGTSAAWIEEKIGILTRATTLPLDYIKLTRNQDPKEAIDAALMSPTDLGFQAAKMALERAGIGGSDIGMILCNCCTPVGTAPSESHRIAERFGIDGIAAFDVFTACPVFALHIDLLNRYRPEELPDYILCISTATLTQRVNYNDRTDGAIWGDGAAAYVVSSRHAGKLKVDYSNYVTDPSRCEAVVVDTYGYFHQDGRAVRNFSVLQTVKMARELEAQFSVNWNRDIFIGHQANYTMLQQITNNRGISESNHWHNVTTIGNQAGAGAPATLAEHWDEIKPGQKIVVAVVGAGLSWGSLLLQMP
ncbi:MAG: hypothetical protein KDD53_03170 [Bdellovibrionales bacterium]|nr:hypothetical protein [Bdellovibrionales bacterium]